LGPNPVIECCEGYELYRYIMGGAEGCNSETYHYYCIEEGQSVDNCYRKV
jgi:hypothetical protein